MSQLLHSRLDIADFDPVFTLLVERVESISGSYNIAVSK